VDAEKTLQLLFHANRLKAIPRVGWQMRGVFHPETVAEHTFGVAFLAMILADSIEEEVDRERLLAIALLHDLGEAFTTDLPEPASKFLPQGAKREAEDAVLQDMLRDLPFAEDYFELWLEFEDRTSVEGRLVRDVDKLEMMIQAYVYEQSTGNHNLGEFWKFMEHYPLEFEATRKLFQLLQERRQSHLPPLS
jgi:putative hydrolase of HD superfamily